MRDDSILLVIEFKEDAGWLGGSIYIDNLIAALSLLPVCEQPRVHVRFLSSPCTAMAKRLRGHAVVAPTYSGRLASLAVLARRAVRSAKRHMPLLRYLDTMGRCRLFFPEFDTRQSWRRRLFWIPDFQHHHLPQMFSEEDIVRRTQNYRAIADSEGYLLLSSRSALQDFQRFYPGARVVPRVWSFCSSTDMSRTDGDWHAVLRRFDLPEKFLYVANQFWEHKDHRTVVYALGLLRQRGLQIPLVCTGRENDHRNPGYFSELKRLVVELGLEQQVNFLGVLARDEQVQLFRCAAAIVQPSRFEGWSTVIEDAKALGRPVIASNLDVHLEQLDATPNSRFFAVNDARALADVIEKAWPKLKAGPELRAEESASVQASQCRLSSARQFISIAREALA